ncbi:RNA 2',3'-cyclic phosphodiesterase [Immundisolibacter sp.]|uniref:RNA 2',3'-cyclic phosphodiesterase n=1 Tax=Immundisolibacter sp. TaxID=1934948 RepID=UPI0026087567|nr:RNA 2',3'-cyclic phosphodiesterase [Immundisolibacter sp.]MDD3650294.1 RNA 2',3'-cyclic phosphodiesterase [Immundisolibacter sp.]
MAATERLFFALLPPPAIQAELGRLAAWCERRCGGRAVVPENIHLTLLFLGELAPGQVEAVCRAPAGLRVAPFEVRLERIEYWPRPRLYCAVPLQPLAAAAALAAALQQAVRDVVAVPARPFSAHVTLLRRPRRLQELPMPPIAWTATGFCLMSARRVDGELHYVPVESWACA